MPAGIAGKAENKYKIGDNMLIKAVNENRLLKVIISIILCLTVTAFTILMKCVEVYAIPIALPLIGAGLLIGVGILVMAGLSFESTDQATISANNWYIDMKYGKYGRMLGIGEEERQKALTDFWNMKESSEEIKTVSDDLWNYTKAWVNDTYDEGENNINRDLYTVVDDEGNYIVYCLNDDDRVLLGNTIEWKGDIYEWTYDGQAIVSGELKHKYKLYRNGDEVVKVIYNLSNECPQFYIVADDFDKLRLGYEYIYSYETSNIVRGTITTQESKLSGYEDQIQAAKAIADYYEYNIAATGVVGVVDNPEWDYETADGERSIYVPTNGEIDNYVGLTNDELLTITDWAIAGEPVPGEIEDEEKTWWQELVGGVSAKIEEGAQLLVGTLAELKAWLDGTYQNIIGSVNEAAASIEDTIEAQQAEDIEPILQGFSITNLIILFLDVLLACIRLIIRACVYLATIVGIEPDGSMLNNDTQSGLDFFKNQVIPVINISIWDMYSGLMTLVISLAVVKRVRRIAE